jgi:hypothetical protein
MQVNSFMPSPNTMGLKLPGIRSFAHSPPPDSTSYQIPVVEMPLPAAPSVTEQLQACFSCGTTNTPMWRRNPQGKPVCNVRNFFRLKQKIKAHWRLATFFLGMR